MSISVHRFRVVAVVVELGRYQLVYTVTKVSGKGVTVGVVLWEKHRPSILNFLIGRPGRA
jgi:hypothetical protein